MVAQSHLEAPSHSKQIFGSELGQRGHWEECQHWRFGVESEQETQKLTDFVYSYICWFCHLKRESDIKFAAEARSDVPFLFLFDPALPGLTHRV